MSEGTKFKIALIQMSMTGDEDRNLKVAAEKVKEAAALGAQVICLPELYRSLYFCQQEDTSFFNSAESIPGPSTEVLSSVAREQGVIVIAPLFEKRASGVYHNSAVVIEKDGSLLGTYRKMHIPDDPGYYEKYYFTPGDLGFLCLHTSVGRIAVLICWDQWFPEAARLCTLKGASVIFYPTAIGWHPQEKAQYGVAQREAWQTVQRGHAIANGIYVAACNRIGLEKPSTSGAGIEFWGSSFICDPQGVVLSEGRVDSEEILTADIDPVHMEDVRRNWPFLRDRRIDAYAELLNRYIDTEK